MLPRRIVTAKRGLPQTANVKTIMPTNTALSRRSFASLLASAAALAAVPLPQAVAKSAKEEPASDVVRLSANENPYGPSPIALSAMRDAMAITYRYPDEAVDALSADLAKLHGVPTDQVILGAGSSEILKLIGLAYLGPGKTIAIADPTFEALPHYAASHGAQIVKVPLDARFAHDTEKLAATNASVIYVCNPNNPTASITPKAAVRALLDAAPRSVIVVDEAYHHYVDSADYESVIPLVSKYPNLIVTRTFSKVYGIAGLRCGYGIAQNAAMEPLRRQQAWDSMNTMALAAAHASLGDAKQVPDGKRRNRETRAQLVRDLATLGYSIIPSEANFVMIDLRRDVKPLIGALRERGVEVGRLFPALPHHMRVTIGTPAQMRRFVEALTAVVA